MAGLSQILSSTSHALCSCFGEPFFFYVSGSRHYIYIFNIGKKVEVFIVVYQPPPPFNNCGK